MSDDEDVVVAKKPKQIHYGSLEEQEKARLAALAAAAKEGVEDNGKDLGDIQISNGKQKSYYFNIFTKLQFQQSRSTLF